MAAAMLTSCGRQPRNTQSELPVEEQVALLRDELLALALTVADSQTLHSEVEDIRNAVGQLEFQVMSERVATLRPNSDGYTIIRTSLGYITVDLASISPNANGTSVVLKFGNPLASDLRDVEMWLRYGETDSQGNPVEGGGKSKHVKLEKVLRGGRFTTVRVGLDDIKPDRLGFISIGNLSHGGIALNQ